MRFSSDFRSDILTEALRFSNLFNEKSVQTKQYRCLKHHWSDTKKSVILELTASCIYQRDANSYRLLTNYDYKDIEYIGFVNDIPSAFLIAHGGFGRLHMFQCEEREALFKGILDYSGNCIGVPVRVKKDQISSTLFLNEKFGKYSSDECITSLSEFTVYKNSERHEEPVRRILCLTESCIVERDPASYSICSLKPLSEIFAIIRDEENPQKFSIQYMKGIIRVYTSTDRDSLLATVLDGVRASGNRDVFIKMRPTKSGLRIGSFSEFIDEEVETLHLKSLQQLPEGINFNEMMIRFNVNIPYSGIINAVTQDGLFAENKDKLIYGALAALRDFDDTNVLSEALEQEFHAFRRLVASKSGFHAFTNLAKFRETTGKKVVQALKRADDAVTYSAIEFLNALMQPMHADYDLKQEQLNKSSLLSSKKFLEGLMDIFSTHVRQGTGALVISALLDFFTYSLCPPYSETTDGDNFDVLLEMVANNGRIFYKLFQHPSMAIVKGAGMIMKAIIEEGTTEIATKMQNLALAEGALPRHLHISMFTQSLDTRLLTMRQLSRNLVSLWCTENDIALSVLKRILPAGLLSALESDESVPKDRDLMNIRDNLRLAMDNAEKKQNRIISQNLLNAQSIKIIEKQLNNVLQHWKQRLNPPKPDTNDRVIVLRKRRQRVKSKENWDLFYYKFNLDHTQPNLLWNFKTREELRESIENEIRSFNIDKDLGQGHVISWNFAEFEVPYNCLADEIKIGEYYLRVLLECGSVSYDTIEIKNPHIFFNDLYHRFLLSTKVTMKCMCLQAMTIVYTKCFEEIGQFNDTKYIIGMLDKSSDKLERDRLLLFIEALILHKSNIKDILDANGVRILVDLVTLAHLHKNRAYVPTQTNVIEASPDMERESEKEWYYGNKQGPCSFKEICELFTTNVIDAKTRLWAQGMDGWRNIDKIPQLKWCLQATSQALMNETEMAILILNILLRISEHYPSRDSDNAIIRPLPRIKRLLSEQTCLPHIVQLLLTFDPIIIEKVTTLMNLIVQDNPIVSRVYLSGVFFFIVMYTGSNVLPIGRFLQYTHSKQAFRSADDPTNSNSNSTSEILRNSILSPILPEAMICYLENHGYEKFAQIFLGEFDTPEVIWNNDMRRHMIEKIAGHLADFTPRLQSNTRALYQYCAIPIINYKQLESELFCNIYYLKHLCDTTRFPEWPIKEPIQLLKDCLLTWKNELEKKPPQMSRDEAFQILELKASDVHKESKVRKAYFKLAQKYHPDKNKDGREMFEKVNKAYEFLCNASKIKDGPDPTNIALLIKAQIILYERFAELLMPYKYAGYAMLIQTVRTETNDEQLFSKKYDLLSVSTQLVYQTIRCSALNAEELRRENGLHLLNDAFSRCVGVLSKLSKQESEMSVLVCLYTAKSYCVAAQFSECREKFLEIKTLIKDLCRCLNFKYLTHLCISICQTIAEFAKYDQRLQDEIYKCGAIYHLLYYMFSYDFTLDEGGVERDTTTNQQEVANNLARECLNTLINLSSNNFIKQILISLLTPYLVKSLNGSASKMRDEGFLKILNSNTENPYLIWNNATRAELSCYLEEHREILYKKGEISDSDYGFSFRYTSLETELVVGDIYVRVYNEQPTFVLENPKKFSIDLLDYIGSQAQYMYSAFMNNNTESIELFDKKVADIEKSLESLRNCIRNNDGVDVQCIGQFKLLFTLLRLSKYDKIQNLTLEILLTVTTNKDCVNDIAQAEVLVNLLLTLYSVQPTTQMIALETLYALCSNNKIVKDIVNTGGILYLLNIFANNNLAHVRQKSAELFAKMMSDKLTGPRIRLLLQRFLPPLFMDAMKDSPEAAVLTFEGTYENPELIWNDETRKRVADKIRQMCTAHFEAQMKNIDHKWSMAEELLAAGVDSSSMSTLYSGDTQNEIVVSGVFIRLFIANPGWVLRKPKEFLVDLFELWSEVCNRKAQEGEVLEQLTQALAQLFNAQPNLLDYVPTMGSLPQVAQALSSKKSSIVGSALQVLNQLVNNDACLKSMAANEWMAPLKQAMQKRPDLVSTAAETLSKIYACPTVVDEFVGQAVRCDLVDYLLGVLESNLEQVEKPASVKALIVKALKAMLNSLQYSEKVEGILNASRIWKDFRDQKHDLFITHTTTAGYLMGATPAVAGYLTAGSATNTINDKVPPPVDPLSELN